MPGRMLHFATAVFDIFNPILNYDYHVAASLCSYMPSVMRVGSVLSRPVWLCINAALQCCSALYQAWESDGDCEVLLTSGPLKTLGSFMSFHTYRSLVEPL